MTNHGEDKQEGVYRGSSSVWLELQGQAGGDEWRRRSEVIVN